MSSPRSPLDSPSGMHASRVETCLIDKDGVLVREKHPIEAAKRFIELLRARDTPFLVL